MKKEVIITLNAVHTVDEESEHVELVTTGTYYHKNNLYYIVYEESEETGFSGTTTTLKIDGEDKITLLRHGTTRTQMMIERGCRHLCHYDTGFGQMMVGIYAGSIVSSLDDDGGEICFSYTVDINAALASENQMKIRVRPAS